MYDLLKSMNEYPVICEVARRREYGICWKEPRVVMQDLKEIGSIPETIEKPIYYLAQEMLRNMAIQSEYLSVAPRSDNDSKSSYLVSYSAGGYLAKRPL